MARTDLIQPDLVPEQIVAWNLRAARELKGWTQTEATQHLAEYGIQWSVASLSDAERSWHPDSRYREFTASDLVTFSLAFDLPLTWWLLPPSIDEVGNMTIGLAGATDLDRSQILDLIYETTPAIDQRLAQLEAPPALTARQSRRMAAHLETQEHQLRRLLDDVMAAQKSLRTEERNRYWTDEGDGDG